MSSAILPPTIVMRRDGSLVQLPTGLVFPRLLARLPRTDVRVFDPSGHSLGATYREADVVAPWATLYSLPAKGREGLFEHFVEAEEELDRVHREAKVVARRRFAVAFEGARRALGMQLEVRGFGAPGLPERVATRGWLLLIQTGGWFLKARVTARDCDARAGLKLVEASVREAFRPFLESVIDLTPGTPVA